METTLAMPRTDDARVVVPAPGPGPGHWSGAPSAVLVDGTFWLTYRVRRPLDAGRGVAVVVARSQDGERFETVVEVPREDLGAESFERPVIVPVDGVGWRLYLSCATPASKHWWVDSLTAPAVADLRAGERRVVLAGDERTAVKDPVVEHHGGRWHLWLCCHPLDLPGAEDRMTTRYLTSADGLAWDDHGEVLRGRAGQWDARGTRVTTVLRRDPLTVLYDGRPDAVSNWYERTGVAVAGPDGALTARDAEPLGSPWSDRALRYVQAVPLPDGRTRFYFEAARPDGAHDLLTSLG